MFAPILPASVRRSVTTISLFVLAVALTAKAIDLVAAGAAWS